ncbi:MAG TPA: hypothetical protein VLB79_14050 [Solirubrobacterales bacterium]|nr:hypothetical protein [Solirubrobacterales bacterium]
MRPAQLAISGPKNLSTSLSTLGTLQLSQGNYGVRSTFDVRQNAANANISCVLRRTASARISPTQAAVC